jgi:hypothetical protein
MSGGTEREQLEERLLDLLYGELPDAEAEALRTRVAAHPDLAARLAGWEKVRVVAAQLPDLEPDPQLHYDLVRAARAAAEAQPTVFERWFGWLSQPALASAVTVVAVAVLGVGTTMMLSRGLDERAPLEAQRATSPAAEAPPSAVLKVPAPALEARPEEAKAAQTAVIPPDAPSPDAPPAARLARGGALTEEAPKGSAVWGDTANAVDDLLLDALPSSRPDAKFATNADAPAMVAAKVNKQKKGRKKKAARARRGGSKKDALKDLGGSLFDAADDREADPAPVATRVEAPKSKAKTPQRARPPARRPQKPRPKPAPDPRPTTPAPEPEPEPQTAQKVVADPFAAAEPAPQAVEGTAEAPLEAQRYAPPPPPPSTVSTGNRRAASASAQGDLGLADADDRDVERKTLDDGVATGAAGELGGDTVGDKAEVAAGVAAAAAEEDGDGVEQARARDANAPAAAAEREVRQGRTGPGEGGAAQVPVSLRTARLARQRGELRRAVAAYESYLSENEGHSAFGSALFETAQSYEALGDLSRALQLYRLAARQDGATGGRAQQRVTALTAQLEAAEARQAPAKAGPVSAPADQLEAVESDQ